MMAKLDRMSLHFDEVHVWDDVRARVLPTMVRKKSTYLFPPALVVTMVIYKIMDVTVGFGVAVLLKPLVLLAVALLLVWHRQNPFRLLETLNGSPSTTFR
jgi:hypothetical protein